MTRPKSLSQSFDIGEFIPPDILIAVDASTREAAADILVRGGLTDDIERITDLRADAPSIQDSMLNGLVPSMNPDEFISYDRPKPPEMTGFDDHGLEIAIIEPAEEPEPPAEETLPESEPEAESGAGEQLSAEYDLVDVRITIPDLGRIEHTGDMVEEDIIVEMPEVSKYNANLIKVKLDTLRFDREFIIKVRLVSVIVVLSGAIVLLVTYLLIH